MTPLPPPVPAASQAGKSRLTLMLLSCLVCPGAGQLMQRRWGAGIFFLVTNLLAVLWLLWPVFVILKAYYGLGLASIYTSVEVPELPGLASIMIPLAVWVVIFVLNLIDTAVAGYKQQVLSSRRPKF